MDIRDKITAYSLCKVLKIILYQPFVVQFDTFIPTELEIIPLSLLSSATKKLIFFPVWSDLTGNTCHSFNRSDLISSL